MTDTSRLQRKLNRHVADLAISFTHGNAHGPGLYVQMLRSLGAANRDPGGEEAGGGNKPGSRPPGWRADVSGWIADVHARTDDWADLWLGHRHPPLHVLRLLSDLPIADSGKLAATVDTLSRWTSQAEIVLGYKVPSRELPNTVCRKRVITRSGWKVIGCRASMLRAPGVIERDADAAVWCSNPECHDSETNPDCYQNPDGTWSCRTSEHDRTHCIRWAAKEFAQLYLAQQQPA